MIAPKTEAEIYARDKKLVALGGKLQDVFNELERMDTGVLRDAHYFRHEMSNIEHAMTGLRVTRRKLAEQLGLLLLEIK